MSYPDWVEDRFGDDIPDWAEERWGDDDDDFDDFDDDDLSDYERNNRKECKISMRRFFNNVQLKYSNSYMEDYIHNLSYWNSLKEAVKEMKWVLEEDNLIAVNPKDDKGYTVYVCENIQKLANVFNIKISAINTCSNITGAMDVVKNYKKLISKDLVAEIESFFQKMNDMRNGHFEFLCPYQDTESMNNMLNAINAQYQNTCFRGFKDLCKRFAYSLDLSDIEEKIDKNIQEINKKKKKEGHYITYKIEKLNKENEELSKNLMMIKNSSYFSRETFAMLYIRLEDYVKKENAIIDLISKPVQVLEITD